MAAKASTRNRAWLYLSIAMLLLVAGSVAAISVLDPSGWAWRGGMILAAAAGALWLPARVVFIAAPFVWLGPHYLRFQTQATGLLQTEGLLEIPGLIALVLLGMLVRRQVRGMGKEAATTGHSARLLWQLDEKTGAYIEDLLREAVEQELARSRRFGREFALMLAAIDPLRVRFDYRDKGKWTAGLKATAAILLDTRRHIDRVFRHGERGFALLLPETGPSQIGGLLRRLTNAAKTASPAEGEPGGPLPLHFGVTFFPQCATTVDDLLRRAEVALRLAEGKPTRIQIDGAEAPGLAAPELSRRKRGGDAGAAASAPAPGLQEETAPPENAHSVAPASHPVLPSLSAAQVRQPGGSVRAGETRLETGAAVPAAAPEEDAATEHAGDVEQVRPARARRAIDPEIEITVSGLLERLGQTAELLRSLKESERPD